MNAKAKQAFKWIAIAVACFIGALAIALALMDWNALKRPIERIASARSGRYISLGRVEVHIFSSAPNVTAEGVVIGNPPWEPAPRMLEVERVRLQLRLLPLLRGDVILPRLELRRARLYLHRDPQGRANWTFANTRPTNAPAKPPPTLPVVQNLLIEEGTLTVRDEILRLEVDGTIEAHEQGSQKNPKALRIEGRGTLNRKPFDLQVAGGPLTHLDPRHPYPFDLRVSAGDIHVESRGRIDKPFDFGHLQLTVRAEGSDLADLYYLTHLALPNTPPYEVSADIQRSEKQIRVTNFAGKVGQSDVSGDFTVDASRKRPAISGELVSKRLRLVDLAASLGAKPNTVDGLQKEATQSRPSKNGAQQAPPASVQLFPDAHLQVDRVRAMDADVRFRGESVQAGAWPLKHVGFHIKLQEGLLSLAPFELTLPQGQLLGTGQVNARGKTPTTRIDVRIRDVQLDQFKGRKPDAKPALAGTLQGRVMLEGHGDSVHDVMAEANGQAFFVVPHGEVRAAFAELTGINVARGIGLLLKGDDDRAEIRCGVAGLTIKDGIMHVDQLIFDTEDVRISASGEIRLGPEELDLSIKGEPKKLRLIRVRTPINLNGHLKKPQVGVDAGKTLKQGAIATALGAIATPFAAIAAFIDPGLAKDENCAALVAAQSSEVSAPRGAMSGR